MLKRLRNIANSAHPMPAASKTNPVSSQEFADVSPIVTSPGSRPKSSHPTAARRTGMAIRIPSEATVIRLKAATKGKVKTGSSGGAEDREIGIVGQQLIKGIEQRRTNWVRGRMRNFLD